MKFIPLHTKNTKIVYKNLLCSPATLIVVAFAAISVVAPVVLVSLFRPYLGFSDFRVIHEQPQLNFQYQGFLFTEISSSNEGRKLIVCSILPNFGTYFHDRFGGKHCEHVKYWVEDVNYDNTIDRAHFTIKLDDTVTDEVLSMQLVLVFQIKIKSNCLISPAAFLTHTINLPKGKPLRLGTIFLKSELRYIQNFELICPLSVRNKATKNDTKNGAYSDRFSHFQVESELKQARANSSYFELFVLETYFRYKSTPGVVLKLDLDVPQVGIRYRLNIWERLGEYWLYFASFFCIGFYVVNKLKDVLFGSHIIPAFEVIPWKRIY